MVQEINLGACLSAVERQLRRHYEGDAEGVLVNVADVLYLYDVLRADFKRTNKRAWKSSLKDLGID